MTKSTVNRRRVASRRSGPVRSRRYIISPGDAQEVAQVFQVFGELAAVNAAREVYRRILSAAFPFRGKVRGKFAPDSAQKVQFEFHTGDYGCRFRTATLDRPSGTIRDSRGFRVKERGTDVSVELRTANTHAK